MKIISPFLFLLFLFCSLSANAKDRVALIIGNNAYGQASLKNPVNDARAIGRVLKNIGFDIVPAYNVNRTGMENALEAFGNKAASAKIAIIYYAGHALQVDGNNYLVPANTPVKHRRDLRKLINLNDLVAEAEQARGLGLVILDACRDNPFVDNLKRSIGRSLGGRGLARIEDTSSKILIGFATKENAIAADGVGNHSPYAKALLRYLPQKNLEIRLLFGKVNDAVKRATGRKQKPYTYGSLGGEEWFLAGNKQVPPPIPQFKEPEMVSIRGGCYQMGQTASDKQWLIKQSDQKTYNEYYRDEKQHKVCVDRFYMAKNEVTRGEFRQFVTATGYKTEAEKESNKGCRVFTDRKWQWKKGTSWKNTAYSQTDQHPVACVSWHDAIAYANWIKQQTGKAYGLPTEAQWEYAARAGTKTLRYWGDDKQNKQACSYANVTDKTSVNKYNWASAFTCKDGYAETSPVGRFSANRFGVNDMLGNVWEWICSAYNKDYNGSEKQCVGKNNTSNRVLRGGSWSDIPRHVRSAFRNSYTASYRGNDTGFRLSRTN